MCPWMSGLMFCYFPSCVRKTVELCQIAEHTGVSFLTVHGRTTTQRSEPADMEAIRIIKENVSVPVFANGDVRTLQDAQMVQEMTGVDGRFHLQFWHFIYGKSLHHI